MVTVHGINIFPSTIEAMVRELPEIVEYRAELQRAHALDELCLTIECASDAEAIAADLRQSMHDRLNLRAPVPIAALGSLPRFELKARRCIDHRSYP